MARFITRVELHNAGVEDYNILHNEMENQNFSKTILSYQNVIYNLPTAEYYKEGEYTYEEVLESAILAATNTDRHYSILVSEAINIVWSNLDLVVV